MSNENYRLSAEIPMAFDPTEAGAPDGLVDRYYELDMLIATTDNGEIAVISDIPNRRFSVIINICGSFDQAFQAVIEQAFADLSHYADGKVSARKLVKEGGKWRRLVFAPMNHTNSHRPSADDAAGIAPSSA